MMSAIATTRADITRSFVIILLLPVHGEQYVVSHYHEVPDGAGRDYEDCVFRSWFNAGLL